MELVEFEYGDVTAYELRAEKREESNFLKKIKRFMPAHKNAKLRLAEVREDMGEIEALVFHEK